VRQTRGSRAQGLRGVALDARTGEAALKLALADQAAGRLLRTRLLPR
jgi:hypothetical protein